VNGVLIYVAIVLIALALNTRTRKYRPGRLVVWFGLVWLAAVAFLAPLYLIFHPQTWVLWVSAAALGLVMPDPKWIRRSVPVESHHSEDRQPSPGGEA